MLTISKSQWDSMKNVKRQGFIDDVASEIQNKYPRQVGHLDDATLSDIVCQFVDNAAENKFNTNGEIRQFVLLSLKLGASFYEDPQLPWASKILQSAGRSFEKMNSRIPSTSLR